MASVVAALRGLAMAEAVGVFTKVLTASGALEKASKAAATRRSTEGGGRFGLLFRRILATERAETCQPAGVRVRATCSSLPKPRTSMVESVFRTTSWKRRTGGVC
jgi:hypothetical protein